MVFWDSLYKSPGEIGLQYRNANLSDSILFVKSLKNSREIDNFIFSFVFKDDNKHKNKSFDYNGYFIVGAEPTDEEVWKDNIKNIKAANRNSLIKWDIIFDEIYSYMNNTEFEENKKIINKKHQAKLVVDKTFIVGTDEYESFVYEIFFRNLIDKNICFKKDINMIIILLLW